VIGCLLIGLSLSPVGAQTGLVNGQVTVRSDGAVYLISNGMRRWVATVVITDEELNAYPEAEPIYAGLAPFGSASAGTATKTGTTASTGNTAAKTTGTTGTTATKTTGNTATKTTGSSQTSTQTTDDEESDDGTIGPGSGADPKDPNDPTLAEVTTSVDPNAKAEPTGKTTCPNSHQIKGGFDKYYWDTDRPDYATVEPEACFVSGAYAREFGYIEIKKKPGSSTTTKPTPTSTPKPR
jgi:hypothetical protein